MKTPVLSKMFAGLIAVSLAVAGSVLGTSPVLAAPDAVQGGVTAKAQVDAGSGTCAATAKEHPRAYVYNVLDFGADAAGTAADFARDSQPAVQAAIAAINARPDTSIPAILCFPRGTYDLYPDKAVTRTYYVTNTVGEKAAYATKHIAMHFEDAANVIIDGDGSLLRMHGQQTILSAVRSHHIAAQNFAIDWVTPRVFEMTTTAARTENGKVIREYRTAPGYQVEVKGNSLQVSSEKSPYTGQPYWSYNTMSSYKSWTDNIESFTQHTHDLETGNSARTGWYSNELLFGGVEKIEKTSDSSYTFTYGAGSNPGNLGKVFQMRTLVRDTPGMFIWESKDTTIENLDIGYLHGFGIVSQFSDSLTLRDTNFRAPADSWRQDVGFADLLQVSGDKGKITIDHCNFGFAHDDPINIHGTYVQLTAKNGKQGTFRYQHLETAGFPQFYPGDTIRLINKNNMTEVPNWEGTVVSVQGPTGEAYSGDLREFTVTFDKPLPSEAVANKVVAENYTYSPEVEITNSHFESVATRGILVTTRKPVVINHNTFDQMKMASIYISGDANNWYESSAVRDVAITNNTFMKPVSQTIFVDPIGTSSNTGQAVHENIKITGNTFITNVPTTAIDAKSVKGIKIADNNYVIYGLNPKLSLADTKLDIGGTTQARVDGASANTKPLYWFYSSTDVAIADNHYGYGQNPGYGINHGMSDSDVSITDPDVTKAGGSVGRIAYESSNQAIATVDAHGVVTGRSEGTVTITAALVGETGIVRSNSVDVTVSATHSSGTAIMEPIDFDVVRPDLRRVSAQGDSLTMIPAAGSEWATQTADNLLRVPGKSLSVGESATVKLDGRTGAGWEEAGLMLYVDDSNYVSIQRKHNGGTPMLRVVTEENGEPNENREITDPKQNSLWLRLARTESGIQGSYSLDGSTFTHLGDAVVNSSVGDNAAITLVTAGKYSSASDSRVFAYSDLTIGDAKVALTRERQPGAADSIPAGKSDDANLLSAKANIALASDGVDLREDDGYVTTLDSSVSIVNLSVKKADSDSVLTYRLNGRILEGETGTQVAIPVTSGATVLEVYVTAPSGKAQRVYRWTFLRDGELTQTPQVRLATPKKPTFDAMKLEYMIPENDGIVYLKDGHPIEPGVYTAQPTSTVTITAVPALGYILGDVAPWSYTFPEAEEKPDVPQTPDEPGTPDTPKVPDTPDASDAPSNPNGDKVNDGKAIHSLKKAAELGKIERLSDTGSHALVLSILSVLLVAVGVVLVQRRGRASLS